MPAPTRLVVSVVSVCALAVPLAACGAKDGSTASADRTASRHTTPVAASVDPVESFLQRVRAGLGDAGTVHMVATATGSMSGTAAGDISYGPDGPRVRLTASLPMLGQGRAHLVLVDHKAYVSVPGLTPAGKYVEMDKGSMPSIPGGVPQVSPEKMFSAVRAAVVGVEDLGSADLAGTPTTRYRLTLDPAKAMRALGGAGMHGMPTPHKATVDVWLDGSDRVRRIQTDLQGTTVVVDLSSWGTPVHIEAPPAADVVTGPRVMMPGGMTRS